MSYIGGDPDPFFISKLRRARLLLPPDGIGAKEKKVFAANKGKLRSVVESRTRETFGSTNCVGPKIKVKDDLCNRSLLSSLAVDFLIP